MKTTYLKLYKQWMQNGIPRFGLCYGLAATHYGSKLDEYLELFRPSDDEKLELKTLGLNTTYWASGSSNDLWTVITPLREKAKQFNLIYTPEPVML